jgi:hypothetical protein
MIDPTNDIPNSIVRKKAKAVHHQLFMQDINAIFINALTGLRVFGKHYLRPK